MIATKVSEAMQNYKFPDDEEYTQEARIVNLIATIIKKMSNAIGVAIEINNKKIIEDLMNAHPLLKRPHP